MGAPASGVKSRSVGDVLESRGIDQATLAALAGKGSPLHQKYGVYVDLVTIASVPEDYESVLR
jgi:hypothetical protein